MAKNDEQKVLKQNPQSGNIMNFLDCAVDLLQSITYFDNELETLNKIEKAEKFIKKTKELIVKNIK